MKRVFILFLLIGTLSAQTLKLNNNTASVDASGNVLSGSNYMLEGYGSGKCVFRSTELIIQAGSQPEFEMNVTVGSGAFNSPSITNATDMAKTETKGSFSLDTGGELLTLDLTPNVVGVVAVTVTCHDLNSSSTSEMYFPYATTGGNNLIIKIRKRGSVNDVDWISIVDTGDYFTFTITYITST